jgi:hypothetical protein
MKEESYPQSVQNCVRRCRRVARIALAVVTLFWIIFGIIASTGQAQGGVGALFSGTNMLMPVGGIIILWFIAWKWEIPGGLLIIVASIFLAFYLKVFEGGSTEALMVITPLLMTGFMFFFIGLRIWAAIRSTKQQ